MTVSQSFKAATDLLRRPIIRALACLLPALAIVTPTYAQNAEAPQETFATPAEAAEALAAAAKADGIDALIRVLGAEAEDLVHSGDEVADMAARERFLAAYQEAHELSPSGEGRNTLVIGSDQYPFPIPLVSENGRWRFDSEAGADEILTRRIGQNELNTIRALIAYGAAQDEYASVDRDGKGPQYARRLLSTPGKKDGLYWPVAAGEEQSPIGPLVAEAQAEGYVSGRAGETSTPYHGYVFKMLYSQGKAAPGGARDFIVNGRMIGGYGLVGAPATYGNSGVMTFIISHDGIIYQKDLGPDSRGIAAKMRVFDPDTSWEAVPVDAVLAE